MHILDPMSRPTFAYSLSVSGFPYTHHENENLYPKYFPLHELKDRIKEEMQDLGASYKIIINVFLCTEQHKYTNSLMLDVRLLKAARFLDEYIDAEVCKLHRFLIDGYLENEYFMPNQQTKNKE